MLFLPLRLLPFVAFSPFLLFIKTRSITSALAVSYPCAPQSIFSFNNRRKQNFLVSAPFMTCCVDRERRAVLRHRSKNPPQRTRRRPKCRFPDFLSEPLHLVYRKATPQISERRLTENRNNPSPMAGSPMWRLLLRSSAVRCRAAV